jgi:hypothetical protein
MNERIPQIKGSQFSACVSRKIDRKASEESELRLWGPEAERKHNRDRGKEWEKEWTSS